MTAKKLKSKQAIDSFLTEQGITHFTSKNHRRVSQYVENNWLKFASFIDKGLKNGTLSGKPVKLNTYFEEERIRRNSVINELSILTKEENHLISLLKKHDDFMRLSKAHSFFNKRGINLPSGQDGISRIMKQLPRIQFILQHELYPEFLESLKSQQ